MLRPYATRLPLLYRHVAQVFRPDVLEQRPNEHVVLVLLQDLRAPARYAADGEDRDREVVRYAEEGVDGAGVEVDVDVDAACLVGHHVLLYLLEDCVPLGMAQLLAEAARLLPHVAGARVLGLVDGGAEAHDLLVAVELSLDVRVGAAGVTDLGRHLANGLGGAAVQRPLQRPYGAHDSRVHVAEGGGGYAGGEGGGVGAVLGVEKEVEVHRLNGLSARLAAFEHVEEVRGAAKVLARSDGIESVADTVVGGDDGWELGDEALRFAEIGLARVVVDVRVEGGESGDGGAQGVHGVGDLDKADDLDDGGGKGPLAPEPASELLELCAGRQSAVEEEVADLLEVGALRQVVDRAAAVEEDAGLAVDEARLSCVENYVAEAAGKGGLHLGVLPLPWSGSKIPFQGRAREQHRFPAPHPGADPQYSTLDLTPKAQLPS